MHSYLSQSEKTKNENSLHCWQWHRCNFPHPQGSQGKYEAQGHWQVNISMWSSRCSSACSSHCDHFYRTTSSTCCNPSSMSLAAKAPWRRWGNSAQLHGQPLHSPCCELHKMKKKHKKDATATMKPQETLGFVTLKNTLPDRIGSLGAHISIQLPDPPSWSLEVQWRWCFFAVDSDADDLQVLHLFF